MPYQPNPFVNPNQRGVELPAGCKDLLDVLKTHGGKHGPGRTWIEYGGLGEVETRVLNFFKSSAKRKLFSMGILEKRIFMALRVHEREVSLNLFVYDDQIDAKEALVRVFEAPKSGQQDGNRQYVSIPLESWTAKFVSHALAVFLGKGFGVTEEERMMFVYFEVEGA